MVNEAVIVQKAKAGDERAFEQLVAAYQKKVYTIAYRNTGNEQDALDICQEVFIRLYKSLPRFKEESAFSTWLYRITSNICIDFSRKKRGKGTIPLYIQGEDTGEIPLEIPDMSNVPELLLEGKELQDEIAAALLLLSESHRQIVLLRDITGLSYTEISHILSTPEGTVKSRLARAREHLRKILISKGTVKEKSRLSDVKGGMARE